MKIKTHGNKDVEQELAADFKHAGKVRFVSPDSLTVTSFVTTIDSQVEEPYTFVDGEVLNVFIAFDLGVVIVTPQMERDRLIPLPLEQFASIMDDFGEWKKEHPNESGGNGIEEVVWYDPMLPIEFE